MHTMYYLSLMVGKLIFLISKISGKGYGGTWPGHVVLKIYPDFLEKKETVYKKGLVLISGTNGKTTTAKLLSHILRSNGFSVASNRSGANLVNGFVSSVLIDTDLLGRVKSDIGVFEVDEFNLPILLKKLSVVPKVLVLLNLSRDQLDRYGEIDAILDKWSQMLTDLNTVSDKCTLCINGEQPEFEKLSQIYSGESVRFLADPQTLKYTNLVGEFNSINMGAALKTAELFEVTKEQAVAVLNTFDAAYGRGEKISVLGKDFTLFLAKNPMSFNHNLKMLLHEHLNTEALLFVLNDEIRDGRDVSWIYDIEPELLSTVCKGKKIFVAGSRSFDFAVRLKYCDVNVGLSNVFINLNSCINAIKHSINIKNVLVLPNYSAMLQTRKVLLGRQIL